MAKSKKKLSNQPSGATTSDTRDLVTMYARLMQTLENVCGSEALARHLAENRSATDVDATVLPSPALSRSFRRLGLIGPDDDIDAFIGDFSRKMADSVSRPQPHILRIARLFASGDPEMELRPVCGATPQCALCQLTRECEYFNNPRKPEMALLTPAARLVTGNEQALSDAELLAVALYGDKATGHEEVILTMLSRYGRLRAVFRAEIQEYQAIRDMGKPQALRLAAMATLHRRLLAEHRNEKLHIGSAQDIYDRYAAELRDYQVEAAVLLMLDQQNNVIRDAWFCDGSPNMAHVAIADLLRPAVREYASRVALVHNHPSDNPNPSAADHDFTRRLRSACDIIGLALVDHVIVTESGYYSFAEDGLLGL